MSARQLIAPLPFLTLSTGATITVEAIDPATGAPITGVTVSLVAIYGSNATPGQTLEEAMDTIYTHEGNA